MPPVVRRRRRAWLLAGLGLAVLVVLGVVGGRRWLAEHHRRAAQACLDRRDYEAAWHHLERSLELRPDAAATHFLAARTARRVARYDEADRQLAACQRLGW